MTTQQQVKTEDKDQKKVVTLSEAEAKEIENIFEGAKDFRTI
jgi:hypothetical protein